MDLLFYSEVEAFYGPQLVRTYYFDNDVKATAELWELDIPEGHELYGEYKDYAYVWDVSVETPSEYEGVSFLNNIGQIAVRAGQGDGGEETSRAIVGLIVESCEMPVCQA